MPSRRPSVHSPDPHPTEEPPWPSKPDSPPRLHPQGPGRQRRSSLSSFRGDEAVALVFYPFTFTGVCEGELCQLRDDLGDFESAGVQVLAVSCDSVPAQKVWAEQKGWTFPVLSDFWPHGEVARAYGVFNDSRGLRHAGHVPDRQGGHRGRHLRHRQPRHRPRQEPVRRGAGQALTRRVPHVGRRPPLSGPPVCGVAGGGGARGEIGIGGNADPAALVTGPAATGARVAR